MTLMDSPSLRPFSAHLTSATGEDWSWAGPGWRPPVAAVRRAPSRPRGRSHPLALAVALFFLVHLPLLAAAIMIGAQAEALLPVPFLGFFVGLLVFAAMLTLFDSPYRRWSYLPIGAIWLCGAAMALGLA